MASPATGWSVGSWTGTNNDASTSTSNVLSMPAGSSTVSVNYLQAPPPCYSFGTLANPPAGGSVSVLTPPNCPNGYAAETGLSLRATPNSGVSFSSWSGKV